MIRLQKLIALSGICSRRKAEELILAGKVKVNDEVVTTLGTKVSEDATIKVNDKVINKVEKAYYLLNKPQGYLTTMSDPFNRRTIKDLYSDKLIKERVFPVGRLDYETSGALILTNDGTLAYRLTNNQNKISKVYQVRTIGLITQEMINKLLKGILLDGILFKAENIKDIIIEKKINQSSFILTISEGKNRLVRSLVKELGLEIKWIKRLSFGSISINGLKEGEIRALKPHEIKVLYSL